MHTAYMGTSGSGKSTLAQAHARHYQTVLNREILVFDPNFASARGRRELLDRWKDAALISADPQEFAKVVFDSENCAVFIDECVEFFDKGNFIDGIAIVTRGRHHGHVVGCIGQHYYAMPPSVRNNITKFFCGRVSKNIAVEVAKDSGDDAFRNAPKLRNRQFIVKIDDQDAFLLDTQKVNLWETD